MPSPYPAALPRRVVTITVVWVLLALLLVTSPVTFPLATLVDAVTRRPGWPTVRMVAFAVAALWIEATSELVVLWSWVSQPFSRRSWTERNHALMHWWAGRLIRGAQRVVGLRFHVEGPTDLGPGPLIVFSQHVSIVDAVMPAYLLGTEGGWYLRYTLTRGLRFDPCLDIVGQRIPNHFVARGQADNAEGLATLRTLVSGMEADEAAVIFPGGGLFTPAGLARAQAKLAERGSPQAEAARGLRHVLPPRPGGALAFFDGAPDANVVIVGHVGFEQVGSVKRLRRVLPLRRPVEIRVWRHDRATVPEGDEARLDWLYARWAEMDEWIDQRLAARADDEEETS